MIDWLSVSFGVKSFSDKTVLFIALLLQASSGQIYLLLTLVFTKCKSPWLMVKSVRMSSTRQRDWNEVAFVPASGLT